MEDFFEKQNDLTAAKVKIYKGYITAYLPKILQTFECCLIADLFCGAGKNGSEDGSPLVLLDRAKYLLADPVIQRKKPNVEIIFNDKNVTNSDDLKSHLNGFEHPSINILAITNIDFQTILIDILQKFKNSKTPKFFFLDPFTYSDVTLENLKSLMVLPHSEVFLFTPIFHSYRFSSKTDFSNDHKTRKFVEEFTTRGMANYSDIDEFMQSIKEKLKLELGLDYVRPVLLDDGSRKNAIFLLTKHKQGMLEMSKIAFKESDDGKGVNIKKQQSGQGDLFGTQETSRFEVFTEKLEQKLKNNKKMTNTEIVDFTIQEEFLPKHAKDAIKIIGIKTKMVIMDENGDNITSKEGKWNIAEKTNKNIVFTYDN